MTKLAITLLLAVLGCNGAVGVPDSRIQDKPKERWGGWYVHYADPNRGDKLGIMLRDLGPFRDGPIPQGWLTGLADKLYREKDNSIILRFAYDYSPAGEDAPLQKVLDHIEQLAPIIKGNGSKLFALQAGFIGAWGEWHSSTNGLLEGNYPQQIFAALAQAHDGWLQVRTPRIRQTLLPHWPSSLSERTGIHNDCFLASESDMGTYPEPHQHWAEAPVVFRGGETCVKSRRTSCENALPEIKRQRFRYLNLGYHADVIKQWKDEGCFDEIGQGLRWGWD